MNQNYELIWQQVLSGVEQTHFFPDDTFKNWVSKTNLFQIDGDIAYVGYRTVVFESILNQNPDSRTLFDDILSDVWGSQVTIQWSSYRQLQQAMPERDISQRAKSLIQPKFNPDYTFDNYIEGKSNQEAYAACLASVTQRQALFNPILLYGHSGLGKTHLLHAIGNYLKEKRPEVKVFYAYSGDLVSILLDAMKTRNVHGNTVEMVQSQLIDHDFFLIDDIQNLTQSSSQEVFFKVYNALVDKGAQIILSSDMHPHELRGIEARLVSRFSNGLVVNIQKPELDTAKAILLKKIEGYEASFPVQDAVIDYLATSFNDDVRKLEGALKRLVFNVTIENPEVIDLAFAQKVLSDMPIQNKEEGLNLKTIKKAVTQYYGLSYADIEGHARQKKLVTARHLFVYLSHELLQESWTAIAVQLGGRDHSTIKSSYERALLLLKKDETFQIALNQIREKL